MYHYNPTTALEEMREEAVLPNPVHVRDMLLRAHSKARRISGIESTFSRLSDALRRASEAGQTDFGAVGTAGSVSLELATNH